MNVPRAQETPNVFGYGIDGLSPAFRPTRVRPDKQLADARLVLTVDGNRRRVLDVSISGLQFRLHPDDAFSAGREVSLQLWMEPKGTRPGESEGPAVEADVLYSGIGRIVRADGRNCAVWLLTGTIDMPALAERERQLAYRSRINRHQATRNLVPPEYREVVEELSFFVRDHKDLVAPREEALRRSGDANPEALEALTEDLYQRMEPTWRELRKRAAAAVLPWMAEPARVDAMAEYTSRMVTRDIIGAPLVWRAFTKPLGYAGDFGTMMHVYRDAFEGPDAVDRVFHRFVSREPLGEGVRRRRDMMREFTRTEHQRVQAERGDDSRFQVMSLGCGPALELSEYAGACESWKGSAHWLLVDQEERALSVAYDAGLTAVRKNGKEGTVRCVNLRMRDVLFGRLAETEPLDLIYAAGLFDYLSTDRARQLLRVLVDSLRPGGLLTVGNARADDVQFWVPHFLLDWRLLYRTEADMYDLGAHLHDEVDPALTLEPAGAYWFLQLRKRA